MQTFLHKLQISHRTSLGKLVTMQNELAQKLATCVFSLAIFIRYQRRKKHRLGPERFMFFKSLDPSPGSILTWEPVLGDRYWRLRLLVVPSLTCSLSLVSEQLMMTAGRSETGIEVFDGVSWKVCFHLRHPVSEHAAMCNVDGSVHLIGGRGPHHSSKSVLGQVGSWKKPQAMHVARCNHGVCQLGELDMMTMAVGGEVDVLSSGVTAEVRGVSGKWQFVARPIQHKMQEWARLARLEKTIYCLKQFDYHSQTAMQSYDIAGNQFWKVNGRGPPRRMFFRAGDNPASSSPTLTAVPDHQLISVTNGRGWAYLPENGQIVELATNFYSYDIHSCSIVMAMLWNQQVVIAGHRCLLESYDGVADRWLPWDTQMNSSHKSGAGVTVLGPVSV